jgi:DNA invertase Pin-like site-specific DNA recombinase
MKAIAYSYIRFSTPKQLEGDSLRRQTDATEAWCARNKVKLNTEHTLRASGGERLPR